MSIPIPSREKQHNVIFDTDEGSDQPAATAIWDGEKLADPEYKGTKTNYQFVDWFLDDQVFNFKKTQITEPITLTAKWRLNRYSIRFNENGGTGKMKDQLLDYEEEKSLSENAFTRNGYTFDTWNTKIDGQGTTYTDKQTVKNLSSEDGATITLYAQWKANNYQVQFDSNGGEGMMASQPMTYDQTTNLIENTFTRKGYAFSGWNTQEDGKGTTYTDKVAVKNLTTKKDGQVKLYAQWKIETYIIDFDSNGGETVPSKNYTVETESFSLPKAERKGYTFQGWYDGDKTIKTIEKGSTGDKELTAKWKVIEYTVSFDSGGGSEVLDQTYTIEQGIASFKVPTRKGYTFQGWYGEEGIEVERIEDGETGNRTLTAQWKIDTYTIDFDSNGGEAVSSNKYTVETESFSLPKAERKGYTFQGWYDGDKKIETIEKGSTGDKELTAKWKAIEYTVSFDSAGGSEVTDQTYTIEQGIDSFKAPTRKGYTFQGWYDEEGKEVERIEDGETGNRALVAKWTIITYTITFDDLAMDPITYTVESDTIPLPKKERVGHTFLGWLVEEDTIARVLSDQPMIVQEIKSGTTGNLKLSAQWKANQYTISFDPNGGIGELPSQTLNYDESVKLSANKFTRTGYAFTGWNTQADGKGTTFTDQQEVKNLLAEANGNLTLFAQWKTTKTALDELVNKEAEAKRNKNDYTQESWKKYEDALKQAQGVLADLNATEDEVKTALTELQAAIANLKPFKNSDQIAQTSTRKTYPTSAAKSYPGTGMLAGSGLMILGVAAVGTAIAGWKKRKGK